VLNVNTFNNGKSRLEQSGENMDSERQALLPVVSVVLIDSKI